MKGGSKVRCECRQREWNSPSCAHGFRLCSVRWKVVGAGGFGYHRISINAAVRRGGMVRRKKLSR